MSELYCRNLPWKETRDPYRIWISEIILQQTKVSQGIDYYLRFLDTFPDIKSLADAPLDQVLKLWEGLGYYSRARNLHFAAQQILSNHEGVFPNQYHEVKKLKGIGPYTAAAITSFAYGYHYPAIDGNAIRILSRVLGIMEDTTTATVFKEIEDFANRAIKNVDPAAFNQTMMDIGAQLCTPKNPECHKCAFQEECIASKENLTKVIPMKAGKKMVKQRYFHYFFITDGKKCIIRQRKNKDIWRELYELPLIETNSSSLEGFESTLTLDDKLSPIASYIHKLTHQQIFVFFYKVQKSKVKKINKDQSLVLYKNLLNFAFPRVINKFFEEYTIQLGILDS